VEYLWNTLLEYLEFLELLPRIPAGIPGIPNALSPQLHAFIHKSIKIISFFHPKPTFGHLIAY